MDYNFDEIKLTPFCIGGLLSVEFNLRVEVEYKMKRQKSEFVLHFQYYDGELNEIKEIINQKNNNSFGVSEDSNINSISSENNKKNEEKRDDFVIIENNDIEKVFFGQEK